MPALRHLVVEGLFYPAVPAALRSAHHCLRFDIRLEVPARAVPASEGP